MAMSIVINIVQLYTPQRVKPYNYITCTYIHIGGTYICRYMYNKYSLTNIVLFSIVDLPSIWIKGYNLSVCHIYFKANVYIHPSMYLSVL